VAAVAGRRLERGVLQHCVRSDALAKAGWPVLDEAQRGVRPRPKNGLWPPRPLNVAGARLGFGRLSSRRLVEPTSELCMNCVIDAGSA
jgi:hypothetical protein